MITEVVCDDGRIGVAVENWAFHRSLVVPVTCGSHDEAVAWLVATHGGPCRVEVVEGDRKVSYQNALRNAIQPFFYN